jgi:arylsulfatase A-like enzyme
MASELNRRKFLGISGASMVAGMVGAQGGLSQTAGGNADGAEIPAEKRPTARRPNIILFFPDELRADSLACYGNPVTKTPNFDRLAKEGAQFANCHVQYPVCGASRCSLLTGWPTSVRGHRSLYYFLRPEEPNLFRYLRRAGYDVFWFGKNDALAAQSFPDSVTRWVDMASAKFRNPKVESATPGSMSMLYTAGGDRRETQDYAHLQEAIEILERKETDRPFCIFLPLINPHPPYTAPEGFYDMYSPADVPAPVPPIREKKPTFHAGIREMYGLDKLNEAKFRKIRAVYYGQVSYSDWLLGELMAALEKTGHDKDTALLLGSDHGDYTGDYGLIEKWPSGLEDCLTHVPQMVRVPGGKPGVVSEDMTELYDLMATALELAGVEAEHTHFARSLMPQIGGKPGDPGRASFAEGGYNVYEPQCFEPPGSGGGPYVDKVRLQNERPQTVSRSSMVRTRTHKLIVRPQGQSELYSYPSDPQERENLYGDSSVAAVQAELQQKLLEQYINTTGIAPFDKDSRNSPPFYPTNWELRETNWQEKVLDKA